jgi:hypothetical protein
VTREGSTREPASGAGLVPVGAALGVLAFLVAGGHAWLPTDTLIADETFYVLQARRLREGQLLWFDSTSTLTWAFALVPFAGTAWLARLASAAAGAAAAGLAIHLLRRSLGAGPAVLTVAFVVTRVSAAHPLAAAYSDGWGVLWMLLWLAWHLQAPRSARSAVGALLLTFALASRLSFLVLAPGLVAALGARAGPPYAKPLLRVGAEVGAAAALAAAIAHLAGNELLAEKAALPSLDELLARLGTLPDYAGWPLVTLGSVGLVGLSRERPAWRGLPLATVLILVMELCNRAWHERYHFPILALLALGAAWQVSRWNVHDARVGAVAILVLALASLPTLSTAIPDAHNRLVLEPGQGCTEVAHLVSSCDEQVTLPFLTQARRSTCTYRAEVELPRGAARLSASYVDDRAPITVDGRPIGDAHALALFRADLPLSPGRHTIALRVENDVAFGGVGQILFCGRGPEPTDAVTRRVRAAFRTVLDREPDPEGLSVYRRALQAGTRSAELCGILLESEELRARGGESAEILVARGYRVAHGRAPAEAERTSALARAERGELREVLGELVEAASSPLP